ncbi:MAG: helicase-exonuclease AddAB subunit AddB, partial [Schwartzia sp.]|nr:helicase-exonuclease AddAB subunit AddB [Schwartzia sp. (in: firmicutes)]
MVQSADAVHITLPLDRDVAADEEVKPSSLFYRAAHTLQRLKRLAEETGVPYTVRLLGKPYRFGTEAKGISALEGGLFRFPVRPERSAENACGIQVVEAATRRLELEAAGADMIRLCREKAFRWRDIGILLRDGENYGELLEFVLQEYDIPFFTDRKRAGVHHPLAEFIRSALEVLTDGWTYDAVFRCVKTDLLPLSNDETDMLENYVLEFGIRGESSWRKEWPYRHRRGTETDFDGRLLQTVNDARKKVAAPFLSLANALKAETVREKTCALYDFLTGLHVPERLAEWMEEAKSAGALEEAKEHRMIWGKVTELLDQMVSVSGEENIALSDYAELMADGLDAMELSLIPQKIDAVTIASFDQNSLNNIRALYILGVNEGVMPRRPSAGGILSEADRALLSSQKGKVRIELSTTAEEESCGENYLLYHGFTEAREYLWVSYSLSDSEGKGIGRSSVVTRLLKLLPTIELQSAPLEGMTKEQERRLLFATG